MIIKRWLAACCICIPAACICQQALPVKKGDRYELSSMKGQLMEIDPGTGGRITRLQIGSVNFLTDSFVNRDNWGSTFWPGPQSDWNWPPPAAWDNRPYTSQLAGRSLEMESVPDPVTGLSVSKIFSANEKGGYYHLEYIITNHSNVVRKAAPWEVTRVHPNGFSFFPVGKGNLRGGLISQTRLVDGICWYTYDQQKIPDSGDSQLYADGSEGWFAEVNGNIILIKKFPDIPFEAAAPNEGEVELYAIKARPEKSYVEIEQQGAYTELQPAQSFSWIMQWFVRELPPNIKRVPGNPELIRFVRNVVK